MSGRSADVAAGSTSGTWALCPEQNGGRTQQDLPDGSAPDDSAPDGIARDGIIVGAVSPGRPSLRPSYWEVSGTLLLRGCTELAPEASVYQIPHLVATSGNPFVRERLSGAGAARASLPQPCTCRCHSQTGQAPGRATTALAMFRVPRMEVLWSQC